MSLDKRTELLQFFDSMETDRKTLLSELENYPKEVLEKKPSADVWSVTEVIMHLTKAENGAFLYLQKKLEYGGHKKAPLTAGLKQKLLNLAVTLPIRYKAPNIVEVKNDNNIGFSEAVKNWTNVRDALLSTYKTIDEQIIDHELFKHPAAGKMNVVQSVKFMRQHMKHHIKQIHRTLKSVS